MKFKRLRIFLTTPLGISALIIGSAFIVVVFGYGIYRYGVAPAGVDAMSAASKPYSDLLDDILERTPFGENNAKNATRGPVLPGYAFKISMSEGRLYLLKDDELMRTWTIIVSTESNKNNNAKINSGILRVATIDSESGEFSIAGNATEIKVTAGAAPTASATVTIIMSSDELKQLREYLTAGMPVVIEE